MTPAQLAQLEGLYEKATPGEWVQWGECYNRLAAGGRKIINTGGWEHPHKEDDGLADAEFIRAVHNSWPSIRAALAEKDRGGWIPVTERLPELPAAPMPAEVDVLCKVGASVSPVRVFTYSPSEIQPKNPWRNIDGGRPHGHFITHWQPLPPPPEVSP